MNYVVIDLEWNQSNTGEEPEIKEIPFEIIDIGAIKLNNEKKMIDEFIAMPTNDKQALMKFFGDEFIDKE